MIIIDALLKTAIDNLFLDNWINRRAGTALAIFLLEKIQSAELSDKYKWGNFNDQAPNEIAVLLHDAVLILFKAYSLHYLQPKGIEYHLKEIDFFYELELLWKTNKH